MRVAQVLDFLLPRRGARRAALPQHLFNKSLPVSAATTVLAKRGRVRIKMRTVLRLANRDHVTRTVRNLVRTLRNCATASGGTALRSTLPFRPCLTIAAASFWVDRISLRSICLNGSTIGC